MPGQATKSQQLAQTALVRLRLLAVPENVAAVRQALAGLGEAVPIKPAILDDIKMAVTELCTNVILHAYPESPGVLEVEVFPGEQTITIVVRDSGVGFQIKPTERSSRHLGLPLVATLADSFSVSHRSDSSGTEARLAFKY